MDGLCWRYNFLHLAATGSGWGGLSVCDTFCIYVFKIAVAVIKLLVFGNYRSSFLAKEILTKKSQVWYDLGSFWGICEKPRTLELSRFFKKLYVVKWLICNKTQILVLFWLNINISVFRAHKFCMYFTNYINVSNYITLFSLFG